MLGKRDPQRSLLTAAPQLGPAAVDQMGFYGRLATEGHKIFGDDDFAELYCADNGRPSVPPSLLSIARLLQFFDGVSDAEVVERTRYDLRWKVALDLDPLSVQAPFAKSTFQAFRARLTLHEKEGLVFEKSVQAARRVGLLPAKLRVALDSSPVRGRGAVKDTFNLLSDAIVAVLRAVAAENGKAVVNLAREEGLERHVEAASLKGSETVEWSDPAAVSSFLQRLLEDCDRAVALAEASDCASDEAKLLLKVITQDVERDDEAQAPRIRQGVAKDRTVSISDPQMRHGRKSSGHRYDGHKAHVAVEMGSGILTAVQVTAPGEADGAQVQTLMEQTQQTTGHEVADALGDTAYSTREAQKQAEALDVALTTPMPAAPRDRFGPADFTVSEDGTTAHCPAGHASAQQYRCSQAPGGLVHHWSEEDCGACPLKALCTTGRRRSLRVAQDFHDRRERERFAVSPEGREVLRQRLAVEHAIGRLKHLGAECSRYFVWPVEDPQPMVVDGRCGEPASDLGRIGADGGVDPPPGASDAEFRAMGRPEAGAGLRAAHRSPMRASNLRR